MSTNKIDDLSSRLNQLIRQHNQTHQEIRKLKEEVLQLKKDPDLAGKLVEKPVVKSESTLQQKESQWPVQDSIKKETESLSKPKAQKQKSFNIPGKSRNLEEFIGGNLISKIGIGILVLGVGFLVKIAADNGMLNPVVRVSLGFLGGIGLVGLAFFFKEKYKNYSAILLGGGLAILYISAFAAYDFYDLIPKAMAFNLMLVFTAFGVFAAYIYNVQVIAIIGLAGAYAVPVLLSDGTGDVKNLFIYITIVNLGVLVLAFKKYWRALNYITFVLTWGVYFAWYADRFNYEEHFGMSMIFATIFFFTFYAVLLAYKLLHKEQYSLRDVIFLLVNSFVFFGAGYNLIEQIPNGEKWLGLFTISNAVIHFIVAMTIYKKNLADKNLFYLVAGLVLTFLTLTFPIQLDGNWVTIIWIAEAVLVFWIGRTQKVFFYEALSYILAGLSFFSLTHDWAEVYATSIYANEAIMNLTPLFNINFLTSVFVAVGLGAIVWMNGKYKDITLENNWDWIYKVGQFMIPAFLLITTFVAFWLEMAHAGFQGTVQSALNINGGTVYNYDYRKLSEIWQINYGLAFFTGLLLLNQKFWKKEILLNGSIGFVALFILAFIFEGLGTLSQLRSSYLFTGEQNFIPTNAALWLRYVCYAFVGVGMYSSYRAIETSEMKTKARNYLELAMHLVILIILSAELLHLAHVINRPEQGYLLTDKIERVGFSILWGIYSLFLIVIGFWKKRKMLRLAAIGLFGITLVKVFLFDLASSSMTSKTIIFIALGVLLLIISFLYQRYKDIILGDDEEEAEQIPQDVNND